MMTPRGGSFHVESSASPNVPKDGSFCLIKLSCEDWRVVNGVCFKKVSFFENICNSCRFFYNSVNNNRIGLCAWNKRTIVLVRLKDRQFS